MTQMNFELIHWVLSVTCPLCPKSAEKTEDWWEENLLVQASSCSLEALSSFPVQIFILFPLWPTLAKSHTFLFLLLSLIPLRVYVQIETADKNLRMETHLLCGAHPQLCQTATSENRGVQQQFQLFKVCVWPSHSPSANDACADRGRSD